MYFKNAFIATGALVLLSITLICSTQAQVSDALPRNPAAATETAAKEKVDVRQLQSDEFLVDTAYLQDQDEFLHKFRIQRTNGRRWSADFTEEVTVGSEKNQVVFSIPAHLGGNADEQSKGFGDAQIEYSYGLYGDSKSRVTISPGIRLSLPLGNFRAGLRTGGSGGSFKIPVGVMLGRRFGSNSIYEMTFTHSARNTDGDRANTLNTEVGQSFVWFAKPRFNFFVEALWERSQEVTGRGSTANVRSLMISPAIRWVHECKNGLTISPGVAVPIGAGPSRGERNIFFYISFGHPLRKEG